MFARSNIYFRFQLPLITIHITCISLSLRRTSAPIHLTSLLVVLGTQETSCILIAGLLERDSFDLFLPEFDKPWVIHLRETWWCSTNLCTWRPNTVYKNRSVHRHHHPLQPTAGITHIWMGESWMVDEEASVMMITMISSNSPSRQGARTEFLVPNCGFWWWRRSGTLSGKNAEPTLFSGQRPYVGERRARGCGRGGHTTPGAAWPAPCQQVLWAPHGSSPSRLLAPWVFW
jgi:hypothetical protein